MMYRVATKTTVEIVRILHDRMDLQGHIAPAADESGEYRCQLEQGCPGKKERGAASSLPLPARGERSEFARVACGFRVRGRPKKQRGIDESTH